MILKKVALNLKQYLTVICKNLYKRVIIYRRRSERVKTRKPKERLEESYEETKKVVRKRKKVLRIPTEYKEVEKLYVIEDKNDKTKCKIIDNETKMHIDLLVYLHNSFVNIIRYCIGS